MSVPFDCPRCGTVLTMAERAGVEIDYCPQCRGVWLDRGELDKILDRAQEEASRSVAPRATSTRDSTHSGHGDRDRHDGGYRGKKKENWLGELFG